MMWAPCTKLNDWLDSLVAEKVEDLEIISLNYSSGESSAEDAIQVLPVDVRFTTMSKKE
jgi:hypothetical protein